MSTNLLERQAVMDAAAALLDRTGRGAGGALFVVGESGLGKTSVLDEVLRVADMPVGFGRGEVMEQSMPFGLVAQALRSLGGPDPIELAGTVEPSMPFFRVLRWLETRPREPMLLALDDLHWADADSLALFAFLARRLEPLGVALVATLRPWPTAAEEAATALVADGRAELVRLPPLSERSVREMLGEAVDTAAAHEAWELCSGNPLLVEQVILALHRGEHVPHRLALREHLLLSRFAGVGTAALQYATAGAVMGTSFAPELAGDVAGLDDHAVGGALDGLYRAGLVVDAGEGALRFAHPLFSQALYRDLAPPVRRRFHARAFRALAERRIGDGGAEHALRAELVGDADAIAALERAGTTALRRGAVAAALRHLAAAVRFSGDRPAPALLAACADAAILAGRASEAAEALEPSLRRDDLSRTDRVTLLLKLGRALYLERPDRSEAALAEAAALAAGDDDSERAAWALADQAVSAWNASGPVAAASLAARARRLARAAGAPARLHADAAWGLMEAYRGNADGFAVCSRLARRLETGAGAAANASERSPLRGTAILVGLAALCAERFDEAERAFAVVRQEATRTGAASGLLHGSLWGSYIALRRGRLEDALRSVEEGEGLAALDVQRPYALLARAEALLWLGRMHESERQCAEAEPGATGLWFARLHLTHVRAMRLLWEGEPGASDALLGAEEIARSVGLEEPCLLHWAGNAIAAHVAAGRVSDAERVLRWLDGRAAVVPSRWPRFAAALGRARLAAATGDDAAAEAGFRAAPALLDGVELPLQRAEALLAHGAFLRRRRRPADARPHIAEALRLAQAGGAAWLAGAAQAELALTGVRRRAVDEDRDRLTAAERRVAEQAAAGHANAEIARRLGLSVNTVETHLKRVYAKLGVGSRRRLMTIDLDER
jgi:DNA-binding CsgD family transcriptional regulator